MSSQLTIVMYHYVRDPWAQFPRLRARTVDQFRGQLAFIRQHYTVITGGQLMAAVQGEAPLPPRALLLTFDDGYVDHFTTVLPILLDAGLSGCFFPVSSAARDGRLLDVNKIQHVLAAVDDPAKVVRSLRDSVDSAAVEFGIGDSADFEKRFRNDLRYDSWDIAFVKWMLQRALPPKLRSRVVDEMFREFVSRDGSAFGRELYMDLGQLAELIEHGMTVGLHGDGHQFLNDLDDDEQRDDIDAALPMLSELGVGSTPWMMCYPYGAYDNRLIACVRDRGCRVGLTVEPRVALLDQDDPLLLPRIDTNDLPVSSS